MKISTFLLLALCLSMAEARDIYRWVAPDGSVNYSDEPRAGADRITLPEWVPPKIIRPMAPPITPRVDKPRSVAYEQLAITRPAAEENIHDNQGIVEVTVKLDPELVTAKDHRIQLLLDGKAMGAPSPAIGQSLEGVERGKHTVAAQVLDQNDQVLITSEPVVFYMKRQSPMLHPPVNVGTTYPQQAPRAPMAPRAPRAEHSPFIPAPPPPSTPGSGTP